MKSVRVKLSPLEIAMIERITERRGLKNTSSFFVSFFDERCNSPEPRKKFSHRVQLTR